MVNLGKGCLGCLGAVFLFFIVIAVIGSFVGTNKDDTPTNETTTEIHVAATPEENEKPKKEPTTEKKKQEKKKEQKKEAKNPTECEYGDTILKYKECKVTKDNFGNDVIAVYFEFTNNSDENKSYSYTYSTKLFQNGVEIENNYVHVGQETRNAGAELQPGTSAIVADSFNYNGDTSDITLEVEPWVSFGDEKLMTFKLDF